MGLFSGLRAGRREDAELGQGVWRRCHDRYRRGLDRYHQILEGIEGPLYAPLVEVADELSATLIEMRALCMSCQAQAPSSGLDIPAGFSAVHRALSRAGNSLAAVAEAAAMASLSASGAPGSASSAGDSGSAPSEGVPGSAVGSVRRRAEAVFRDLEDAREALTGR